MTRGKVIDPNIRSIIIRLYKSGRSNAEIGQLLGLSRYSVRNVVQLFKSSNNVEPKQRYVKKVHLLILIGGR